MLAGIYSRKFSRPSDFSLDCRATRDLLYMYSKENPMLALRLPPDVEARLDELAKRTGRSKSFYAREAILEYLDDLEDIYLAEKRLEDVRSGRSDSVALEDLMKAYGLED
jgi:RHH-type rel operon transcriptional repressor/antitoxin RelB